jgi:hypothetical protein
LPDPLVVVDSINVKRATALIQPNFAPARPKVGAGSEMAAVWVQLAISFHVFTLPQGGNV